MVDQGYLTLDFRKYAHPLLSFGLPILFLLTPVAYPCEVVPEPWAWLVRLNPLAHLIEAWRDVLLGQPPDPRGLLAAAAAGVVTCAAGAWTLEALRDSIPEEL